MNRQEQSPISHRKKIPRDRDNKGVTQNPSDQLTVSRKPFQEMGVKIVSNETISCPGQFELRLTTVQNFRNKKVVELIPLAVEPLTPVISAPRRRVYGGGTSKDALRRAKRKKS